MAPYVFIFYVFFLGFNVNGQGVFDDFFTQINAEELFELSQNGQLGRYLESSEKPETIISINILKSLNFNDIILNSSDQIQLKENNLEIIRNEYRLKDDILMQVKSKLISYMQEKFIYSISLADLSKLAQEKYQHSDKKYLKFFQAYWNNKEIREEPFRVEISSIEFESLKKIMEIKNKVDPRFKNIATEQEINELMNINKATNEYFAKSWFKNIPAFTNKIKPKSFFAFCSEQSLTIFDFLKTLNNEKLLKHFSIVGRILNKNYSEDNNHVAVLLKSEGGNFFVIDSWPLGGNASPLVYRLEEWQKSKNLLTSHLNLYNCNNSFTR